MSRSSTPKQTVSITGNTPEASVSHSAIHAHYFLSNNRQFPSEPPSTFPSSSIPIEHMAKSTRQRTAEESSSEQPFSKRMRRHSDDEKRKVQSHSSPSSSSQGMLESEMDVDRGQQSPLPALPKKKRTRTLTTPHQSAVLHALLAQSRFPTTAMREEVGRSIGLSARKVQIWFQNQRQKARRPGNQSQSSALLTRPAQYGSFSSLQSSPLAITGTSEDRGVGSSNQPLTAASPLTSEESLPKRRRYDLPETHADRGSQLLGPGMPGSDIPTSPFRGRDLPLPSRRSSESNPHYYASSDYSHIGPQKERYHPSAYTTPRPATAHTSGISRQRSFSRTLPPLVFNVHRPHSSYSGSSEGKLYHLSTSVPVGPSSTLFSVGTKNMSSAGSPFAHQIPDQPPHILAAPYSHTPPSPPLHLRAYPPSQLSSPLHSGPTSWSGRSSFTHPSPPTLVSSPLTTHTQPSSREPPRSASLSPPRVPTPATQLQGPVAEQPISARLGRYDPVRAAFIPIRQTPPPKNGSTPPESHGAETENLSFDSEASREKHDE